MIESKKLTKIYSDKKRGEVVAANNISFKCEKGRIFGLLGPNGAGKTTTLRMLATLIKPTSGTATVNGYDIIEQSEQVRRNIGFMTGETAVYGRLTAREMVEYFGRLFGMEEEMLQDRVEAILDTLDMRSFANVRNANLSTGMRQKVSIARTIVHDPPCLILDEPTTGLDVLTSRTIVDFILQAKAEGKAVLFSTHIMSEAERLCDCVGIIHKGRILEIGDIKELKEITETKTMEDMFIKMVEERYIPDPTKNTALCAE